MFKKLEEIAKYHYLPQWIPIIGFVLARTYEEKDLRLKNQGYSITCINSVYHGVCLNILATKIL